MKKNILQSITSLLLLSSVPTLTFTQDQSVDAKATAVTAATGETTTEPVAQEAIDKATEPEPKTWADDYETLLEKYVSAKGVRYKAWHASKEDLAALGKVIAEISGQKLADFDREEQLAFYLNAYNAWILHRILQDYPTDGPGGGGFFGRNKFFKSDDLKVAGKVTNFTDLESAIIRPKFAEPRIHFALNCASESCPPLHPLAFRKATLDATLTALATAFVNKNPSGLRLIDGGETVELSKIFDWYADDFKGGQVAYINRFRASKISSEAKVVFQDYSWKLNEAP